MALKKLDMYIMRSFVGPLLMCFLAIVGLYVVMDAFDKLEDFLEHGILKLIPLMAEYYFFNIPIFTIQLLPAITLISVCFTLVKMSRVNEILAMRTAGISTYRILLPLFVTAVALSIAAALVQELAVPRFARGLERFNRTVLGNIEKTALRGQLKEPNDVYTYYKFWGYNFNDKEAGRVEIIQIDNRSSSSLLHINDIKGLARLVTKLHDARDPLSKYIREQFQPSTLRLLDKYDSSTYPSQPLQRALVAELNRLIQGDCIYSHERFAQVRLTEETRKLIQQEMQDKDMVFLNRLLLEDAYPHEIEKSHQIRCLIAEGGGKWENGRWVLHDVVMPGMEQMPPVRAIIVDPANPNKLYLGMAEWGVFISEERGESWRKVNEGLASSDRDILFITIDSKARTYRNARLYIGSVGGIFMFDDRAKKWVNIVKEIVISKLKEIPELAKKETDWENLHSTYCVKDTIREAYCALGEGKLALERISQAFDIPNSTPRNIEAYSNFVDIRNVRTILIDNISDFDTANNKIKLYIGTDTGISELEYDRGEWRRPKIYRSRPRRLAGKKIRALVKDAEDRLCVATNNGVYRYGEPSEKREFFGNIGLKQFDIKALVARGNNLFAATLKGIFRRKITPSQPDGSASGQWKLISNGISNLDIQTLTIDGAGILYAGTSSGVFKSENNGDSWTPILGLETKCVKAIAIAPSNLDSASPILYAGTRSKGVFKFEPKKPEQNTEGKEAPSKDENNSYWESINKRDLQQKLPKFYFNSSLRPEKLEADEIDPGLKSFKELRELCRNEPHKPSYRVMMHSRASYTLTSLVLLLLGVPFIIGFEKLSQSRFLGIAACAALCGAFYALNFFCSSLGTSGAINPALAAWIPVILAGAVGIFLFDSINI